MASHVAASPVEAAFLSFDPETISTSVGQEISVDVVLDTDGKQILATDAKIQYDSSVLQVVDVTDGDFLSVGKKSFEEAGQIYIAGLVESAGEFKTGSGVVATVKFKALKNGTATVSYLCTPGETANDSNIANNDIDATDVIVCTDNGTSVITVGTGGTVITATPSATTTSSTRSVTPYTGGGPSELPQTGFMDQIIQFGLPGVLLVIVGLGLKVILL